MKSALNLVLIADSESTQKSVQTRTGIIDLGAFCVELWPKQVSYRISVPMSYISCSRLIKVKKQCSGFRLPVLSGLVHELEQLGKLKKLEK